MTTEDRASGGADAAGHGRRQGRGAPPRRRWQSVLLIVSLALNLFLIGILAGGRIAKWSYPEMPIAFALSPGIVSRLIGELPPGAQAEARRLFEDRRWEIRREMRALRTARVEALEILTAEPFDREAFSEAMVAVRRQTLAVQEVVHEVLIDLSSRVDPETRAMLDAAARGLHRRHHWRPE